MNGKLMTRVGRSVAAVSCDFCRRLLPYLVGQTNSCPCGGPYTTMFFQSDTPAGRRELRRAVARHRWRMCRDER